MGVAHSIDVSKLPATAVPETALTAEPVEDPKVGDLVVIYSRGANRLAEVTKVGPKRVEVVYTTKGAWDTAIKTHAGLTSAAYLTGWERSYTKTFGSNYDFAVRESDPATAKYTGPDGHVKYRAKVEAETRDEYVARHVAEHRADREAKAARAHEIGVKGHVHVTTKSVPRDKVFGLALAVA